MKKKILILLVLSLLIATTGVAYAQGEPETEFDLLQLILDVLSGLLDLVRGLVGWLLEQLRLFFDWIVGAIQGLINLIGDLLNGLLQALQTFLYWLGDAIRGLLEFLGNIFSWVLSIVRSIWDFIGWAIRNVIEIIEILGLFIQVVIGLIGLARAWISQLFSVLFGTLEVLQGATPTPIPGLPQCVTAPLQHNMCAFYYFLENTLLSDGTLGAFILPIAILLIDLWIVFYVIQTVTGIIRQVIRSFQS